MFKTFFQESDPRGIYFVLLNNVREDPKGKERV